MYFIVFSSIEIYLWKKFDFLIIVMNWFLKEVLMFMVFVIYSFERRIKFWYWVFIWLFVEGLLL